MAKQTSVGDLIYEGKYWGPDGAVMLSQKIYESDPEAMLMQYAVTLYSAYNRAKKDGQRDRMRDMLGWFAQIVEKLAVRLDEGIFDLSADEIDVAATHLEWWAGLRPSHAVWLRTIVRSALERGLKITEAAPSWKHTRPLLLLTFARLELAEGNKEASLHYLHRAEGYGPTIRNPDQRSRVYRKSAHLEWKHGYPLKAFAFATKAALVPGIAPDTHAKNLP